jgi:hypothetical protein
MRRSRRYGQANEGATHGDDRRQLPLQVGYAERSASQGTNAMRWWIVHRPLPGHRFEHDPQHVQISGPLASLELAQEEAKRILSLGRRVKGIYDGDNNQVMDEVEITKKLGPPAEIPN